MRWLALILGVAILPGSSIANPVDISNTRGIKGVDNHGAVASEVGVCSEIGIELMKQGGNAADAIIGTVLCVGTIGMYHSGIGGGGFMLVHLPNGTYDFIDFREMAPAAATEDMFDGNPKLSEHGGLASGIPGELRGLERAHTLYCSLPWKSLFQPSINLARHGFRVSEDLINYFNHPSGPFPFLVTDPSWAIDFAPNGTRVKLGETMYRKRYADTLETIAEQGPDVFYYGAIANATIEKLKQTGGIMTLDDLANYTAIHRDPLNIDYRGYKITSTSAPSSGSVALSALKTFEGYEKTGLNLTTHRLVEAIKFAYGERTELGDPSYVSDIDSLEQEMVSEEAAEEIRSKISDFHVLNISDYDPNGLEILETHGTSHIAAVDSSGLAISLTTTVNLIFGSSVMIPETGVIMNNEMNDFSIPGVPNAFGYIPSESNFIRPGKRPLSSMTPTIVEYPNGNLAFVIGSAGGSRIITATIQNIWHVLDQGLSAPAAIAQPRLHDQITPNVTSFEYGYDNATVGYLKSLGHIVGWTAPGGSTAQGIRLTPNGTFEAASEPRQRNSGGYAY